jgi:GntR family transcriptional regulator / MocR family aminotransferase
MKKAPSGILPIMTVDRKAAKALHRQIYDAYRSAIVEHRLQPGQRIPSTRVLAWELGVSRFPVLNAYAQLLAEGYFESKVGAGTVVSSSLPEQLATNAAKGSPPAAVRSGPRPVALRASILPAKEREPWLQGRGPFGVGQVASEQFPLRVWSNLVARRTRCMDAKAFHYGDHMGSPHLRETIAAYLRTARSLRCAAEQIMIVSGSQQGLEISARVLFDPGSRVWVEEPGYHMARNVLSLAGCDLVPVHVDQEGLDVTAGIKRCAKAQAALVTPSHQFPLGVTMSATRRFHLLQWAQETGSWIIEDDYDSEYRYESSPIASMQGLDPHSRVIYIGTFSKVLFPSLRLGYIVIPADLVDRFLTIRRAMDLGPPTFHQEVLADFIREGHFGRHIRRMRVLYRERRSVLVECIARELGSMVEVIGDEAGMHLTVMLPKGRRDLEVSARAARQNLWLWPLSPSYVAESRPGFILGFGSTPVEEIPEAVRKLRNLLTVSR